MKNSKDILPPDQFAIDQEVDDIFQHGDVTKVSIWSGVKYKRLAAMLRIDDPTENCATESVAVMYGLSKHDKDKAKAYFRIFHRHAAEWGLLEEEPIDILQLAIDQLNQTHKDDIKRMDKRTRGLLEQSTGELREVAGHVYQDAILVRREEEGTPRGYDLPLKAAGRS